MSGCSFETLSSETSMQSVYISCLSSSGSLSSMHDCGRLSSFLLMETCRMGPLFLYGYGALSLDLRRGVQGFFVQSGRSMPKTSTL